MKKGTLLQGDNVDFGNRREPERATSAAPGNPISLFSQHSYGGGDGGGCAPPSIGRKMRQSDTKSKTPKGIWIDLMDPMVAFMCHF